MANQTLVEDYVRLSMVNREYGRLRPRWQFILDSFIGGDDYRRAGYLTKYQLESDGDYQARLRATPLDNQCSSIVSTYLSFLFRNDIERNFASWEGMADVEAFLADADYEGRTFNAFMKEVATWSSVFGHTWVLMTKPNAGAQSLGQEIDLGIRPYVNVITPMVVNDWTWRRNLNGSYDLVYIRYIEEVVDKIFKTYLEVYGKNGISKMVLSTMIPLINSHLKILLSDTCDFDLEMRMNDKSEVEFWMIDDESGVHKPLSAGSGYEKTVSSLALRCVLSKVCSLPKPNIIIFDEVTGKVSNDNLDKIALFFDKLKQFFEHIWIISHNPIIQDWADHSVKVKKDDNISKVITD